MQKHHSMEGNREEKGKCVRVKKEGKKFCMEEEGREASGIFGAECLQKGQREQETSAADVLSLQRLLLFC